MRKHLLLSAAVVLFAMQLLLFKSVAAQTQTPPLEATLPPDPVGQVTGSVTYRRNGQAVMETMEVMLHILDQNMQDKGMTHGKSAPDGTFAFSDVPFVTGDQFAVMAIYDGVTYYSEVEPADMLSLQVSLEVPVYESTSDPSDVQIDQMHVVFGTAEDGLEVREIYVFSNLGDRTVKDVFELGQDKFATLKFPLPEDADYIFFKPEDADRFVKLDKGFADTYPLVAGQQPSQVMVNYLVPYSGKRTYTYTAPITIREINLLVPEQSGLFLSGVGLSGPEPMAFENGGTFQLYKFEQLEAGETISLAITGSQPAGFPVSAGLNSTIAAGMFLLGAVVLGAGLWWWKSGSRSEESDEDRRFRRGTDSEFVEFDQIVDKIARLDQLREAGNIDPEEYGRLREALRTQAKDLIEKSERVE